MSGVPYTFASATSSIPLSQLDANFATNATLGNATVGLGNTTTTVGNLTVSNVTINGLSGGGANGVVYINSSNVATANASVLSFTGTNLGIGTSSPSYLLTLSGGNLGFTSGTNGIIFNNSSATTNSTLNDYETGTWTPTAGAGLTTTGTATFVGIYTKIGNLVRINFRITATTIACLASQNLIGNVPFANNQDGIGNFGPGIGLSGNYNYVYQVYNSSIVAWTTVTGVNQVYGTVVYQSTF